MSLRRESDLDDEEDEEEKEEAADDEEEAEASEPVRFLGVNVEEAFLIAS